MSNRIRPCAAEGCDKFGYVWITLKTKRKRAVVCAKHATYQR